VIGISEAGPGNADRCANIMGPNYFYDYHPPSSNKGGVAIYMNKKYNYNIRDDLEIKECHSIDNIWYDLEYGKNKYTVGVLYRHPGYSTCTINNAFETILSNTEHEPNTYLICGDMNIDLFNPEHAQTKQYIYTILSSNTIPYITPQESLPTQQP
jgi:hypothetical protein